jgi:23S rRNA pseudouridine2457 synthase
VLIALNKPFGVACKFSPEPGKRTLADYVPIRDVYPAGRLDTDSEGLLLLTDDGALQRRLSDVAARPRRYRRGHHR